MKVRFADRSAVYDYEFIQRNLKILSSEVLSSQLFSEDQKE